MGDVARRRKDHRDHRNAQPRTPTAGGPLVRAQLPECRLMCSSSECLVVRALLHTVQV